MGKEHREFINGKKNGKINKVVKTSTCRVLFNENDGTNMTIDLYSPTPSRLLLGVQLLEDELPAETSFHIPESFHKRIIGVAGKNIQKIMKTYGVYVKFSNASEFNEMGGYYENNDNVIARTPAKNAASLTDLKAIICDSIAEFDLLEEQAEVDVPRMLHRWLRRPLHEISHFDVSLIFPDCELAIDTIILEGPMGSVEKARNLLKNLIPSIYDFSLPANEPTYSAIKHIEFEQLVSKIYADSDITVLVYCPKIVEGEEDYDYAFYFVYTNLPEKKIQDTKSKILKYFVNKKAILI